MSTTPRPDTETPFPTPPENSVEQPNPYHRIERLIDRTEIYPTERLFQKCIAIAWFFVLAVLLPVVAVLGGLMIACLSLPDPSPAAIIFLTLLCPVIAILLLIWSRDRQAWRDCSTPLVIGNGGAGSQISYRGEASVAVEEVAGVRVIHFVCTEGPDYYSVGFTLLSGNKVVLPSRLPVTWWYGTGQGYFGGWNDQAVAELLASDMARILKRPLLSAEKVQLN